MIRGLLLIALACLGTACGESAGPPVVLDDVEVTAPRPGMGMSAGFLRISNNAKTTLSVTRVDSPQFGAVELHESTIVDGVARMRPVEELIIDPSATLVLERGGKHLMLMRPVDEIDTVTLNFYSGDTLLISVETRVALPPSGS